MIRYYMHKDSGAVTTALTGGALARIAVKRGITLLREIVFHDGSNVVELDPAAAGVFVGKAKSEETGLPEGGPRVWDVDWLPPSQTGGGYVFEVPVYGSSLEAVTKDEDGSRRLVAEIHVANEGRLIKSQSFDFVVGKPVWDEDETPDDPDPPYPLPGEILTKAGNLEGLSDPAAARVNLGLGSALRRLVAAPENDDDPGSPGDYAVSGTELYIYTGDGDETHAWLMFAGANSFGGE